MSDPQALASAAPRIGFIGWSPEAGLIWQTLRAVCPQLAAAPPCYLPGGPREQAESVQIVPTVETLFATCETIFIAAPPEEVEPDMPLMRLSIADRHVLVLLGQNWSVAEVLRHLNERKLVRCLILPFEQAQAPLLSFFPTPYLEAEDVAAFLALFSNLQVILQLEDETQFEVMQGLAGIAPGAFYTIMDAMADGALMMGLPRPQALRFVSAVLLSAAQSILAGEKHPALLREEALQYNVAAAGLMELESAGIRGLMMRAVQRAMVTVKAREGPTRKEPHSP